MKRVAVLVSKMSHCLYDLLIRHRSGEQRRVSQRHVSFSSTLRVGMEECTANISV